MDWLRIVLAEKPRATLWAAWGTLIEKRPYLRGYMRDIVENGQQHGVPWVTFGKSSKAGHPHHPLYLAKSSLPRAFDAGHYAILHGPAANALKRDASSPDE